jgi:hypothetical protein
MNINEDERLPILDLSEFHVVVPPGEIYRMLDAQNDALEKLLGLQELTDDFYRKVSREHHKEKKGALWMSGLLRPRAQTQNDIVAVYLELVGIKNESAVQCRVYLVEFDRFDELRQTLHTKLAKVAKEMENLREGLSGRN